MYLPAHFEQTDATAIAGLVAANPLATLVSTSHGALRADHIPLMLVGDRLIGHVALANDLHETIPDGAHVLAIFQGLDAYISPNWYPGKAEHHRQVPTWNYEVVHVQGTIRFDHSRKAKLAIVGQLTSVMETATHPDQAWRMADAPTDFMDEMLSKIVAFDIAVTGIIGKSKLGQNKPDVDRLGAADALDARGRAVIAKHMRDAKG